MSMHISFRPLLQIEFASVCKLIESAYLPHDPGHLMPGRHPVDLAGPPWTWWGNPVLWWFVGEIKKIMVAFVMWRMVGRNAHIHSFFVRDGWQGKGIGDQLLCFHWEKASAENPFLQTFTLHVRKEAFWARRFYNHHGYKEKEQMNLDPAEDSGLGDWVRNCQTFGSWPLPDGQLLLSRFREGISKNEIRGGKSGI